MKQIKFYGIGGQGVVTAAKLLAIAVSLHENKNAITVPAYGHERRGAPVYADVIIDEQPVRVNCFVYEPDIVVVMDSGLIEKQVDVGAGISERTTLVLNASSAGMADAYRQRFGFQHIYMADATHIAVEHTGRNIPNGSILGALAATGCVSIDSTTAALSEYFAEKAGVDNANAAREAYRTAKKI